MAADTPAPNRAGLVSDVRPWRMILTDAFRDVPDFAPGVAPEDLVGLGPAWWFIVRDDTILLAGDEAAPLVPRLDSVARLGIEIEPPHFLGLLAGRPCWTAAALSTGGEPSGVRWGGLRALFAHLPDDFLAVAGRALQVVAWDQHHRFCGRCGAATDVVPHERARRCPACGSMAFPRIAPAIIVLIERDGQILMARDARFPAGMYGLIAGFVEPGESLEGAARREIMEEVGITVGDLTYVASQPWPFPNSLMVGFTTPWVAGEIDPDPVEIEDAQWFHPDALPSLPSKISIARRLVDEFVAREEKRA